MGILNLELLKNFDARPNRWLFRIGRPLGLFLYRGAAIEITLRGLAEPPSSPVIFAANSTQKYDFMPLRWVMMKRGISIITVSKGKNYHIGLTLPLLKHFGTLPLISRGYILTMDFIALHRRRPTDAEYRILRELVDLDISSNNNTFINNPVIDRTLNQPRNILGYRFEPSRADYRDAVQQLYQLMMNETIRLARELIAAGHHIHIYPEGTVSSRLATGRIGCVELAIALDIPIIPVAMSGAREIFVGKTILPRRGNLVIRCGQPWQVSTEGIPTNFRPFHANDEARYRPILQKQTDLLMTQINELLDPAYQWTTSKIGDGAQGTHRFV